MKTTFLAVPIGGRFERNGNECVKRSTRTALLVQYKRVFYFRLNDVVRLLEVEQ